MKLTLPIAFGVLSAVVVEMMLLLPTQAAPPQAGGESNEPTRQARPADADAVPDIPVFVDGPGPKPYDAPKLTSRPQRSHTPGQRRAISLVPRHDKGLEMRTSGTRPDGSATYHCKGGFVITSKSFKSGTIRIEAEEAEISVGPQPKDEPREFPDQRTMLDHNDSPMKARFKGNVIVREDQGNTPNPRGEWTIHASEVEYDYAADRLLATDAKMEMSSSGSRARSRSRRSE